MLSNAIAKTNQNIYVGYNRPNSPSIKIVKDNFIDNGTPFTLSCFVSGHLIPEDHWYRDPSEGTRIVSNLGHWIDLSVHILSWSSTPFEYVDITISYSDISMPSDNIAVSIVSSNHDLINITFTSRGEPFEGVSEMINFQKDDLIVQIDDYRTTKIWKESYYKRYSHWPKNNGHKSTVLQPFGSVTKREWSEIELSTRIMLHVEKMVTSNTTQSRFSL
jgi:predicted dehydrogenase